MLKRKPVDLPTLRQMIEIDLKTQEEVGGHFGLSRERIGQLCREHGIRTQRTGPRSGEGHPKWAGGRIRDKDGYVLVYRPDHPRARNRGPSLKPIYVLEHILVMEEKLGRSLLPEEVVHHVNGVNDDNRPENLMLFQTNADHLRHELTGRCPQWTPEGRERIAAGVRKASAIRMEKARRARQSPRMSDRPTT